MNNIEEELLAVCNKYPQPIRIEGLVKAICIQHAQNVNGTPNINQIYQLGRLEACINMQLQGYFAHILNPASMMPQGLGKKDMH